MRTDRRLTLESPEERVTEEDSDSHIWSTGVIIGGFRLKVSFHYEYQVQQCFSLIFIDSTCSDFLKFTHNNV